MNVIKFPKIKEIKVLREKIGWSQSKLAEKVGISQSTIPKYESGLQIPSYETAIKMFELLLQEEMLFDPEVSEIMTTKLTIVSRKTPLGEVLDIMKEKSISQVPVVQNKTVVGTISETITLDLLDKYQDIHSLRDANAEDIMGEIMPCVPKSTKLREITPLLRRYSGVLVINEGKLVGIVTKADLLEI